MTGPDVERTPAGPARVIDHPDREEVRTVPDGTIAPSYPYEALRRHTPPPSPDPYIERP